MVFQPKFTLKESDLKWNRNGQTFYLFKVKNFYKRLVLYFGKIPYKIKYFPKRNML